MKKYLLILLLSFKVLFGKSQTDSLVISTDTLTEVRIHAFGLNKHWKDVPASVGRITTKEVAYIGTTNLLPAINTIPGVRMEERSPSSYRLSIRGSLLRSPFGVRNIKIYWNGLPMTDGSGNTYFNLIDATQLSSLEIIKGPAASLYGANTGGVVLLQSNNDFVSMTKNSYCINATGGSFGLFQEGSSWEYQSQNFSSKLIQSHQQSDGYRQQSASQKDNITWEASFKKNKQQFDLISFYTAQMYQTPGGITLAQMLQDPTLARQPANGIPGAVQQQTTIYNNTFFIGLHYTYTINQNWSTEAGIVFHHTDFRNPFITNYEKRNEINFGGNGKLIYQQQYGHLNLQWLSGGELLANHSKIDDYGNRGGVIDTVQFKDNVYINQWFAFTQIQMSGKHFNVNAGISANNQNYRYERLTDANPTFTKKTTDVAVMPRLAALYQFMPQVALYASLSKGFSPPSLAEIRPSSRSFNTTLQPEDGWNVELGLKGSIIKNKLVFDVNYYRFRLQNAIVTRNNTDGTQYFVNAGDTKQNGVEVWLQYHLLRNGAHFFKTIQLTESYSYQPYKFITYQQGASNYSGNQLTGVPKHILVNGLQIAMVKGLFFNVSDTYTSALSLTDANDVFTEAYNLLQAKAGINMKLKKATMQFYIGGDNLLNQLYSLGNDINAVGKRFYNPAAAINFYGGCNINW
ncbi:TonB-dependent receptor [Parasediminibacterium paludis]|uniref:TonB-dependent receptor n=1 Tax=Parasediminibacterium paludis TaxID=908966 RepID=A0ABV8PSU8_9BACT